MKTLFLTILVLLLPLLLIAEKSPTSREDQQHTIDSLKLALDSVTADSAKAKVLGLLGSEFTYINPEKALGFGLEAYELAKKGENQYFISITGKSVGVMYKNQGDLQKAMEYFLEALEICESLDKSEDIAGLLHEVADVYRNQGKFDKALEFSLEAAKMYRKLENKQGIANSYTNIAILNVMTGQGPQALEYFEKALEMRKELGVKTDIAAAMENMASVYNMQGNNKKALEYCFTALAVEEEIDHVHMKASTLGNIGSVYHDMGNVREALKYMKQSLELSKQIKSKPLVASAYGNISLVYRDKGDYKNAYEYDQLQSEIQDSILNEENNRAIVDMQTKYEADKKEKENQILRQEKELRELREREEKERLKSEIAANQRRDNLQYSGILIFIIMLFAGVFFTGKISIPVRLAEGMIFFSFLLFFEFTLVLLDPYIETYSSGAPAIKLGFNAVLAALIFPLHSLFEEKLKNRLGSKSA